MGLMYALTSSKGNHQKAFTHTPQAQVKMNNHLPTAKTCEGCCYLRDDLCRKSNLPVKNLEPQYDCPLNYYPGDNGKNPKNKHYLFRLHIVQKTPVIAISKMLHHSETTIAKWLKEFNIPARSYKKESWQKIY